MKLILYTADCTGNRKNTLYPNRVEVTSPEQLQAAIKRDHVCALYKDSKRSNQNFIESSGIFMDNDNDSDDPSDWLTAEQLSDIFSDYDHAITPSRHNNQWKGNKSPRPRQHIYFPIHTISDVDAYTKLKDKIQKAFPFLDVAAKDSARFFFGCDQDLSDIIWNEGWMLIDDMEFPEDDDASNDIEANTSLVYTGGPIQEGSRNRTMSHFAGRILKRFGLSDQAKQMFLEHAQKCDPPLPKSELSSIWHSAVKFYKRQVEKQDGYIPPEEYNKEFGSGESLRPTDFSDIGQAKVLAREYGNELKYTEGTELIRYNGIYWKESLQAGVGAIEEFLDLQLADAFNDLEAAKQGLADTGISADAIAEGKKALQKEATKTNQQEALNVYMQALAYYSFVMKRRDMRYVTSALNAVKPMVEIPITDLDRDEFLLNTPSYTYDLRKGMKSRKEHDANDLITKCTLVDPGDEGMDIWMEAVNTVFCGDQELIDYAQMISGLCAIGKVYIEALIIAYGDGRNGKSTYWNAQARVLGSYSGGISSDALTVGCKRNVKPEVAELRGKRMVIAAELEDGQRLSTSVLKQLCSTDEVGGEKKFKSPFKFIPTHTLILYTNHLPRVGVNDAGTWRRLIVMPFNAEFEGKSDIKNYADYLVKNAGPAILKWIIEGAEKIIAKDFKLKNPKCVDDAIHAYRSQNDWMAHFLEDCVIVDEKASENSGKVYQAYRNWCLKMGEYARSTADFYTALEAAGFKRRRNAKGNYIYGLKLKEQEFLD